MGRGDSDSEATAPRRDDIAEMRGVFRDGYTEDDIDSVLPRLEEVLPLPKDVMLVCVWEYSDPLGPGGDSEVMYLGQDNKLSSAPIALAAYMYEQEPDPDNPLTADNLHKDGTHYTIDVDSLGEVGMRNLVHEFRD